MEVTELYYVKTIEALELSAICVGKVELLRGVGREGARFANVEMPTIIWAVGFVEEL